MEEKIIEILNDIDEDIVQYEGEDLVEEGIIDSFTIVEILTEIEDKLDIKICIDDVIAENFKSIGTIVALIEVSSNR